MPSISSSSSDAGRKKSPFTFGLVLASCFIDGMDVQLLPASFRALEADLGLTPTNLAQLGLMQAFFMAMLAPFWGSVADLGLVSKKMLLTTAVGCWGVFTIMQSTATSFYILMLLRICTGSCLACVLPLSQTILAQQAEPQERGRTFGMVCFVQSMGQVSSGLFTTSISNMVFMMGGVSIMGWRVAFASVGVASVGLATIIGLFMEEPPRRMSSSSNEGVDSVQGIFSDIFVRIKKYSQISTWRLIVLQGLFGSLPWSALNFLAMYFQYVGFKDEMAATLVMFMMLAMACGHLFGGFLGDLAAEWSKSHGRIIVAQISICAGIPCMFILFRVVPPGVQSFMPYACVLWCHGILAAWVMSGAKRPILSEIVSSDDWASLLALDTAFEGSVRAFGAPSVALIAQHAFGYTPVTGQVQDMIPAIRIQNREALANGMFWMTAVPWIMCLVVFSFMHITYARDLSAMEGNVSEDDFNQLSQEEAPLLMKDDDDGCTSFSGY